MFAPRPVLSVLALAVAGCSPTPPDVTADGGSSVCRTEFVCEDGLCRCTSTTGDCCDPDVCGPSSTSSCEVVCRVCTGVPDAGPGTDAPGDDVPPGFDAGSDAGTPPPPSRCGVAPASCFLDCIVEDRSTSSCVYDCGLAGEPDEVGCAEVCIANDDSTSSCAYHCRLDTPCGRAACARVCIANGDSTSSCAYTCELGPDDGNACADVCIANGDSTSSCAYTCELGPSSSAGCARVCIANGDSTSSCDYTCDFPAGSADCRSVCAANGDSDSSCDYTCGR